MKHLTRRILCFILMGGIFMSAAFPSFAEFYNDPVPNELTSLRDAPLADKYRKLFSYEHMTADGFTAELSYRLYVPADYDPNRAYPVLLFLHGAGENGGGKDENEKQLNVGMMNEFFSRGYFEKFPCLIIAPQTRNEPKNFTGEWVNTPWTKGSYKIDVSGETCGTFTENIQLAKMAVDKTIADYHVDTDRIYVTGISMGGYGTWNIITHYNDFFAAAIPVCGGGDPSKADRLVNMPIWCFHGDQDGGLAVPVTGTRDMYTAIVAAGSTKINYTEWPGVGHAWLPAYAREDVWAWLFAQSKNPVNTTELASALIELKQANLAGMSEEDKLAFDKAFAEAEAVVNGSVAATKETVAAAFSSVAAAKALIPAPKKNTVHFPAWGYLGIAGVAVAAGIAVAVGLKKKAKKTQN